MAVSKARQADARIQQANAGLNVASITASYAAIRAPFDGIVTERHADPGALATPGAPLLVVEKTVGLRLEAHVEESRVPSVKEGAQVAVVIDALGITATGKVDEIVPSVDAAARSFLTKIDLPAIPHLRPGMFGRVTFAGGSDEVVAVPAAAISETGQVQSVFVVEDGVARVRLITRGRQKDEQVEVLTGLGGGEKVISPRPAGLRDGARVEVRP
jgi:RND family efflux transporter MFP subunit